MDQNKADIIALNGLTYIAENEDCLAGYLNLSGTSLEQLKQRISNPETMPSILASIFDYFLQNENYLIEFSNDQNIDPKDIQKARRFFPGAVDF